MTYIILAVFWLFCGWLVIGQRSLIALAAAIALAPFGSLSVVPPEVSGGLTILPTAMLGLIAAGLFVTSRSGLSYLMRSAFAPGRMGLLTALWGVAFLSSYFYPRIFAGQVEVVPLRGDLETVAGGWQMLAPSTQNISQLGYFTISIALVYLFSFVMQYERYQQVILKAVMISGIIAVVTGILDMANLSVLLDPFRNATYSLLVDVNVGGTAKRIVGLMPEASSYGPMCITRAVLLLVWQDAFATPRQRLLAGRVVAPALLLFGCLAISSAAYLTVFTSLCVLGFRMVLQSLYADPAARARHGKRSPLVLWLFGGALLVAVIMVAYSVAPAVFQPITSLLNRMIFEKTSSGSFEQRMLWNAVSLKALVGTWGLGVGIGGTRTSSWPVAVVANLGIPGTLLLLGFALYVFLHPKTYLRPSDRILCLGGLWAVPSLLASGLLTGTAPNLGSGMAMVLGIHAACGAAQTAHARHVAAVKAATPPPDQTKATEQHLPARVDHSASLRRTHP